MFIKPIYNERNQRVEKNQPNVLIVDETKPREDNTLLGSALDLSGCHPTAHKLSDGRGRPLSSGFFFASHLFHWLIAVTPGQAGPGERLDAVVSP